MVANEVSIKINADGTAAITGVQKIESQVNQSMFRIKDAWLKFGAVMASTAFLQSAAKDALAAEQAATKLKFQIESLGVSYANTSGAVQDAINKTSEYARVQDDEATKTLQTLIFNSGKYKESLENLNLVYDTAYQKGIGVEESAMLIGKAMTGNAEMLGRYIPELRNLEQTLGKNATEAQKSAYAMIVLKEKTEGAMQAMGEHEKQIRESVKAYQELKQIAGQVALEVMSAAVNVVSGIGSAINYVIGMAVEGFAKFYDLLGKLPGSLGEPYIRAAQSVRELSQHFSQASEIGARFAERFKITLAVVEQHTAATKKATGAAKEFADTVKNTNDELLISEERNKLWIESQKKLIEESIELLKDAEQQNAAVRAQAAQELFAMFGKEPKMALPEKFSETEQNMQKLKEIDDYWNKRIELMELYKYKEEEINKAKNQAQLDHDRQTMQLRLSAIGNGMGMMSNMMQNLYMATGQKNKEMFTAMKAFAIGETIIQTYRAAQGAYAALAPIPIVGPALAVAAAAAAIASGIARVQQIGSMNPGGSTATISATGTANPSYSGGSPSAYPAPERLEQQQEQYQPKQITIVVEGNIVDHAAFAREIAPYINEAKGDKISYGD